MNLVLMLSFIDGKGFGFRRSGGGFKGGSKHFGAFRQPSTYNRVPNYGTSMNRP